MKINKVMTAEEWVKSWAVRTKLSPNPSPYESEKYRLSVMPEPWNGKGLTFYGPTPELLWERAAKWIYSL